MIMQRSRKNKHGHSPPIFHPLCIRLPSLLFFNLCPAKLPYIVTALIISTITRQRSKVQRYYLCIDNELNSSHRLSLFCSLSLFVYCFLLYSMIINHTHTMEIQSRISISELTRELIARDIGSHSSTCSSAGKRHCRPT